MAFVVILLVGLDSGGFALTPYQLLQLQRLLWP